jgi:predicted regulator of Ras-like GTPase activity (Roadblock/LC7/MglB family)
MTTTTWQDNAWMLEKVATLPGVRHVVVLSRDGLVKTRTAHTDRDRAERIAAGCAGLRSLAQGLAPDDGDFRQVMVEWSGGILFVRGAGDGSCLAVMTDPRIDPTLIGQSMLAQVQIIGESNLSTPSRG